MKGSLLLLVFSLISFDALALEMPPPSATIQISSNVSVCQNSSGPVITFTGSGGTAPYTFTYTINGGAAQTIETTSGNSVTLVAPTSVVGTRTYTLISVDDDTNATANVGAAVSFTVLQQPNASILSSVPPIVFNGFTTFTECVNQPTAFQFINDSSTSSTNSAYVINWGDGSPIENLTSWTSLSHTYNVGLWTLTYTIQSQNSCSVTKIYKIFVGNNPAVGLGNPGNTDVCISTALTFPITGTENNPPGTTYVVTFNDGTTMNYNHPPPPSVTHTFLTSSCGITSNVGSTTYQNSFYASISAINPCDESSATVVPIRISTPPVANFSSPPGNLCVNTNLCFTNTSTGGDSAAASACTTPKVIWSVSPNSGFSVVSGNLGNDNSSSNVNLWSPGANQICLNFSVTGTYTITMKIGTRCGIDTKTQVICVSSPLTPQFTLNTNQGCAPLAITATNTTNTSVSCGTVTNVWSVTHTPAYCGGTIAPISDQSTTNGSFNFTQPGTYNIKLTTTNSCGTTQTTQTVTVKKPPTVSINAIANICGPGNVTPQAIVNSCAPAASAVTYAWSFPGGTPSASTASNPGPISYSTPGTHTVSLVVTNECGSTTATTQSFVLNALPVITNSTLLQTICSGNSMAAIVLSSSIPGTTYNWTATASTGVTGFQPSGTSSTIPSQIINYSGSGTGTLTYSVTPTSGSCSGAPVQFLIQVTPAPVITAQPQPQTICLNATPSPLSISINSGSTTPTYQWYSNNNNSTVGGNAISGANSSTYIPPATTLGTLYYYVIASLGSAGCAALTSQAVAIVVQPLPQISVQSTASQQVCVGGSVGALTVAATGGFGSASYQWYSNTSNANSGGTPIAGATAASYTPAVFNTQGTFYYYAVVSFSGFGCGNVASQVSQITVMPDPTISAQPIASQTLCQGSIPQPLVVSAAGGLGAFSYQWYSNTVNSNAGGSIISGATNASFAPPTAGVGTVFYYCVVSQPTSGCSVSSAVASVIVNTSPAVVNQPALSQVCPGGVPQTLSFTTINGIGTASYQWYSNTSNSNTGGSPIAGETNATYTPPTTIAGTIWYYAEITFSGISGSCATIKTQPATIEVTPGAQVSVQPTPAQTLCVGATIATPLTVSYTGGSGTPTYQWFVNTQNSTSGGTAVGGNSNTYTPPVYAAAGNYYYYVSIQLSSSGCTAVTSNVAIVTVVGDPVVTINPQTPQTLCQGATPQPLEVSASGGDGTFSYQWYSNTSNSTTNGNPIAGATAANYIPPTSGVGTMYYYCIVTQPSPGCSALSSIVSVIVNTSPAVVNQPASSEVCPGGTPQTLGFTTVNGIGTASYQWHSNTSNSNIGGSPIAGETNATYTPPTTIAGTIWYYAEITFSGITGSCATIKTQPATITVTPGAQISVQPTPTQTLCVGASIVTPLSVGYTGGSGTPVYQWYVNTQNTTAGGSPVGTNSASYTPPAYSTAGNYYYYVSIQLSANGCAPVTSDVAHVTVVPDPLAVITPQNMQTLCQGATPEALVVSASGGIGSYWYQWYSNTSDTTVGSSIISGATNDSYTPPTANVGTMYYYCVVTQPSAECEAISGTASITVNVSPAVVNQPVSSEVCLGGVAQTLAFTTINGLGTQSYQWYSNTSNSNLDGVLIAGATSATYLPPSTVEGIIWYYAEITFSGITGSCATIKTEPAMVKVTPAAQISSQPTPAQSLCVGAGIVAPLSATYTGGSGTPTYQWFSNTQNSTSGGIPVGSNTDTFTPPVFTSAGEYYYYVTISLSSSGCLPITSDVATVSVVADPVVLTQPLAAQTVCPDETATTLSLTVSGGIGTDYTYQWHVSSTSTVGTGTAIAGANSPAYLPPTDVSGTLYYYCIIEQPGVNGCNAQSANSVVTISAAPVVTVQPQPQTICGGGAITPLTFTVANGVGSPAYQWYSNTSASNVGGTPITGANASAYHPDNDTVGVFYYYGQVSFPDLLGACSSIATDAVQITIDQNPVISNQTQVICSGNSFTVTPETGGLDIVPASTTYTWTTPVISPAGAVTGFSVQSNPQAFISQPLTNITTSPATVTYTVTPVAGNCPGQPFDIVVTVNPSISPNVTLNDNLCFGANSASIATNVVGGIPFPGSQPYQFDWTGPNGYAASSPSIANLAPGNYTVTITDAGGCPFSQTYVISEPAQLIFGNAVESDVTCNGAANGAITIETNGGTPGYTYSWTKDTAFYSNSQNIAGLSPGTYEVTVSDTHNCGPIAMSFLITEPQPLIASIIAQTNVECFGQGSGALSIAVIGGTTPYTYVWSGPNGFASADLNLTGLFAGDYTLIVTDANGCQFTLGATISQSPEILISYTTTEITCYGANDANMSVQLGGGVGPYTFVWSTLSTSLNQTNLSAGDYTITVTDALGCLKSLTINIPEAPVFMVSPIVTQISCTGANDGSIQLNLVGGIAPVTLIWSDGSTAGLTRNGLGPGVYTATITDGKPCQIVRTFIITNPQPLTLSAQIDNAVACAASNTGAIDLLVSGGTPPYTYSWSTGSASEDLSQLTNGNYAVTVTDSRGCVAIGQYNILRPDPLSIVINTQTDFDCQTHEVNQRFIAQVSGGLPPYQILWSSGTISGVNNEIMETDINGLVVVGAIDALGCTTSYSLTVDIPEIGYADFEPESFGSVSYGIFAIHDPITFTSTLTGDYQTVIWDFGDGTFSNELNPVHTYVSSGSYIVSQTVTYPFGCQYTQVITLLVEEGYFLVVPTAFTPNNDSVNDNYRPISKRLENIRLDIYDSWGSMIYSETGDVLVGWDGNINSVPAENGNYYCKVTAKTFYNQTITQTKAFVLIK